MPKIFLYFILFYYFFSYENKEKMDKRTTFPQNSLKMSEIYPKTANFRPKSTIFTLFFHFLCCLFSGPFCAKNIKKATFWQFFSNFHPNIPASASKFQPFFGHDEAFLTGKWTLFRLFRSLFLSKSPRFLPQNLD